jgi:hypothetical protein
MVKSLNAEQLLVMPIEEIYAYFEFNPNKEQDEDEYDTNPRFRYGVSHGLDASPRAVRADHGHREVAEHVGP